jgi:septal ring factor EnvC (AmiA/AmiB activator)
VRSQPRNGIAPRRVRREARFRRRRFTLVASAVLALAAVGGVGLAGAANPSIDTRIDSAQSDADQLEQRIDQQAAEIAGLEQRAREAGAREMVLTAEIERTTDRSRELADELTAAEAKLDAVQARYKQSVETLSDRLVEIYKGTTPDYLTVLLDSDGYDDLSTRSQYLEVLHDADARLADRVASLQEKVKGDYEAIAGLKAEIDEQARRLEASRTELASTRAEAEQRASEIAEARAATESDLTEVESRVAELVAAQQRQQASEAPVFSGGPYAIPTYIVMCESGGNYQALNPSSGAGGAYQILPSTWRAYGGQGLPHQAPKAEQDRIAAQIWADSGPSAWSCA